MVSVIVIKDNIENIYEKIFRIFTLGLGDAAKMLYMTNDAQQ